MWGIEGKGGEGREELERSKKRGGGLVCRLKKTKEGQAGLVDAERSKKKRLRPGLTLEDPKKSACGPV